MSTFRLARHIKPGTTIIPASSNRNDRLICQVTEVTQTSAWFSFHVDAPVWCGIKTFSIKFLPTDFVEVVPDMIDESGNRL